MKPEICVTVFLLFFNYRAVSSVGGGVPIIRKEGNETITSKYLCNSKRGLQFSHDLIVLGKLVFGSNNLIPNQFEK